MSRFLKAPGVFLLLALLGGGAYRAGVIHERKMNARARPAKPSITKSVVKTPVHHGSVPVAEQVAPSPEAQARNSRFPTVVISLPVKADYLTSPYPDHLIKIHCRGLPDHPEKEFLAVFQCVKKGVLQPAALLRKDMRIALELEPFESQPKAVHELPATDDSMDFSLPEYWVKSFRHDEPLLTVAGIPERFQYVRLFPEMVMKSSIDVPIGGERHPFFYYGSTWQLYQPGAEEFVLMQNPTWVRHSVNHFSKFLKSRGVQLLFVPIPQSASVFPDLALGHDDGMSLKGTPPNGALESLITTLRDDGVTVVDLPRAFREERYLLHEGNRYPVCLPNDSHWSPAGCRKAAQVVAAAVQAVGIPVNPTAGDLFEEKAEITAWDGDIRTMYTVTSLRIAIAPVPTLSYKVTPKNPAAERNLRKPSPQAAVQIIGDSHLLYFRDAESGFHAHLTRELGQAVHASIAVGQGHNEAVRKWIEKSSWNGHARVVVWLVPERSITMQPWYELPTELQGGSAPETASAPLLPAK